MIARADKAKAALSEVVGLESLVSDLVERARMSWPQFDVDPEAFADHVAASIDDAPDPRVALAQLHASDLWLALACGLGKTKAIGLFEEQLAPIVDDALANMREKVSVDDVAQALREKLLVARNGAAPKIFEYSGRGPLYGWIRIAAIRLALSSTRRGDAASMKPVTREMLVDVASAINPELDLLRSRYSKQFKAAFEAGLAELSPEQRNVLRMNLVDGLSIDEIGTLLGVHRATAARMLQRARDLLQKRTRAILRDQLDLGTHELRSILDLVGSQLDLSIARVLTETPLPFDQREELRRPPKAKPTPSPTTAPKTGGLKKPAKSAKPTKPAKPVKSKSRA
ncbi:sigma-70 family RNA polymerase sigma factor [Labilithrix luteola]|nr:sigma-70 family RNA polymerase sigma factor [Labilithrix luteola]